MPDEKPESLQKRVAKNQKIPVFFPDSREIRDEFAADCLHRHTLIYLIDIERIVVSILSLPHISAHILNGLDRSVGNIRALLSRAVRNR